MIAIVHSIYSQSVHAPALDAGLMDNDAERYCTCISIFSKIGSVDQSKPCTLIYLHNIYIANIYTCTRPHPLYHARTPATSDSTSGQYVDDIILAGVVIKNPKI